MNKVKSSMNIFQIQRIKDKFNDVEKIEIHKQCDIEKTIIKNIIKKTTNKKKRKKTKVNSSQRHNVMHIKKIKTSTAKFKQNSKHKQDEICLNLTRIKRFL